jgi:tRNA A37 threonylcarbamoyladenosine synthetase subunit TsaC/SUA5/YrdC
VPAHKTLQTLLAELGQPLLATTLILPGESEPLNDPHGIREQLEHDIQAVVDAGACPMQPTTVLDLTQDVPTVLRMGAGDPAQLGIYLH